MITQGAVVVSGTALTKAELAPTPAQQNAATQGCAAYALQGLTAQQKQGMISAIQAVETNIATAQDMVQGRRARLAIQQQRLQSQAQGVQDGNASVSSLYGYAAPAAASCLDVATGLEYAKEASDFVYTRANELEYQLTLIASADQELAQQELDFSQAVQTLDALILILGG